MIHRGVAFWNRTGGGLVAPTGVTGARDGIDIDLSWTHDGGGGATGFRIYRRSRVPAGSFGAYSLWRTVTPETDVDTVDETASGDLEYQYRVHAWTGSVESDGAESNVVGALTAIQWSLGSPSDYAPDDVSVAWSFEPVTDQNGLQVYFRIGASMFGDPIANGAQAYLGIIPFGNTSLGAEDTTGYFIARARYASAAGDRFGPWSEERAAISRPRVPGVPTGVSLAATGATELTLSWTPGSPTTHDLFDIQIAERDDPGDPWGAWANTTPSTDTASPFVYGTVIEGKLYKMRLKARNTGGSSAYVESNSACVGTTPSTPTIVSVSTTGVADPTGELRVAYSGDAGNSIELRYRVEGTGTWLTDQGPDTNGSPFDLVGLTDGVTYDVQIRAVNLCGDASAWTGTTQGDTEADVPDVPTGVVATPNAGTSDEMDVEWDASFNADDYDVQRAPDSGGSPGTWATIVSGTASTSIVDSGRSPNTKYHYRVRANNAGGSSAYSSSADGTTLIQVPNLGSPATSDYPAGCPSLAGITVNLTHTNSDGDARAEAMTWEYRWAQSGAGVTSASWLGGGSLSSGATSFNVQASGGDGDYYLQVRVQYDSETAWRTTSTINAFCFI